MPYLTTRTSWSTPLDDISRVLIETFVQETRGLAPEDMDVWRLRVKFNAVRQQEMMASCGR